jgi:hypothetical protein
MLRAGISLRAAFAWTALPGALALLTLGLGVRKVVAKRYSKERSDIGLRVPLIYRRVLLAVFIFALGNWSDAFLLWRAREIRIPTEFAPLLWMVLALVKSANLDLGRGIE